MLVVSAARQLMQEGVERLAIFRKQQELPFFEPPGRQVEQDSGRSVRIDDRANTIRQHAGDWYRLEQTLPRSGATPDLRLQPLALQTRTGEVTKESITGFESVVHDLV
jgi:hypothetical protein